MKKLLYLEDDETMGYLTHYCLQNKEIGIEMEWVKDGTTAIKAMRERIFGLILSDYNMPDEEKWREFLSTCDTPLIWLTGHSRDEIIHPACEIGYLQKPVDLQKLVDIIRLKIFSTL